MDISGNQPEEPDPGPQIIISEQEQTQDEIITELLNGIVEQVVNKVNADRKDSRDSRDSQDNKDNKRKLSDLEEVSATFSMGQYVGGGSYKRARKDKHKTKAKKTIKPKLQVENKPIVKEDPKAKHARLLRLLPDTNPYYAHQALLKKILKDDAAEKEPIDFTGKRKQHIYIIIPMLKPKYMPYLSSYHHLQFFNGSLLEWQLMLKETSLLKPWFQQSEKQHQIKYTIPPSRLYGPSKYFTRSANEIYMTNQRLRWAFKRFLNLWLHKKCKERVTDTDLISGEPVPKEDRINIFCIKSRTLYVFTGNSLLKIVKSQLETQQGSICIPKPPKNPFTNIPFTYAQMIKVSRELLKWCAKKGHAYPAILALYEESRYSLNFLVSLHNNYLQYLATKNYVFNDDINGTFFLENLEVLLDTFALFLVHYNRYLDVDVFRAWFEAEKDDPLIKCWRLLICDYWHYTQTEHFIRVAWLTEMSIILDIEILMKVSEPKLRHYY